MPSYKYIAYSPALFGPKGGLVTFSRKPIQNSIYHTFSKRGYLFDISLIDIILQKGFLKVDTDGFKIINTHLTANFSSDWTNKNKYVQVQEIQISQLISVIRKIRQPLIIVGDYNFPDSSSLYNIFLDSVNGEDVYQKNSFATINSSIIPPMKHMLRIDYQIISPRHAMKAINSEKLFGEKVLLKKRYDFISDHFGLRVTYKTV